MFVCVNGSRLSKFLPVRVSILAEDSPAGLEHCCYFISHHEYSEAAVIEDSGGKNSKVMGAHPDMNAKSTFQRLRTPDYSTDFPFSDPRTSGEGGPGDSSESGICSIHQHAHGLLYDVVFKRQQALLCILPHKMHLG